MTNILDDLKKSQEKMSNIIDSGTKKQQHEVSLEENINNHIDVSEVSDIGSKQSQQEQVLSINDNLSDSPKKDIVETNFEYTKSAPAFIPSDDIVDVEPDTTEVFTGGDFKAPSGIPNEKQHPVSQKTVLVDSAGDSVYQEFLKAKQQKLDEKRANENIPQIEVRGIEDTGGQPNHFSGQTQDFVGNFRSSDMIQDGGEKMNNKNINNSFNNSNLKIDSKIENINAGSDFLSNKRSSTFGNSNLPNNKNF